MNAYRTDMYLCGECRTLMAMGWIDKGDFLYCNNINCEHFYKKYKAPKTKKINLKPYTRPSIAEAE